MKTLLQPSSSKLPTLMGSQLCKLCRILAAVNFLLMLAGLIGFVEMAS
ncbi:MAG: hypothetical protein Q8L79_18895 [Methylobacter sp.]|nr:hypothetical protein [Methylobacter sp.]MDP1667177.1 hypothetical protein [Methylobacter sp.]